MFASKGEMGEPCGMPRRMSRASVVRVSPIVGFLHGAVQPHPDQMQHAPINDPARYRLQKLGMGNAPEVVREVGVHHFRMAAKRHLSHRDHHLGSLPKNSSTQLATIS